MGKSLQDKIDARDARYNDLMARRDVLQAVLANRRFTEEAIQRQLEFAGNLRDGIDNATNAEKQAMLDTFKARVTDGKAKLALWMPKEATIELLDI